MSLTPADWYDGFYGGKDYAAEAGTVIEVVDRLAPHARTLLDVACGRGGVLVVEPWFVPERWDEFGRVNVNVVEHGTTKAVRVIATSRVGDVAVLRIHYVEAEPGAIRTEDRREEFGLFTKEQYLDAVAAAGLEPAWEEPGLTGRGLVTGRRPRPG